MTNFAPAISDVSPSVVPAEIPIRRRDRGLRRSRKSPAVFVVLCTVALLMMLPLAWLLVTSLKTDTEISSSAFSLLPGHPEFSNFIAAVTRIDFLRYAGASLFLATVSGVLTTLSSAAGGYAFARFRSRLRGPLFAVLIALMMTPPIITLIPTFLLFARVGLVGTYWPWVLWGLAGSPYLIFLFRQAFASLPRELDEAAIIDGAGFFRIFWQIFLPLSRPILITSFVLSFTAVWADYITPSLFLSDDNTTLAVAVATGYVNAQGFPLRNLVAAGATLYLLPPIAVFAFAQRWYLEGIASTGMK